MAVVKMNRQRRREMKNILTDFKGEAALDLIANIIEPISVIVDDEAVKSLLTSGTDSKELLALTTYLLREHKKEILEILAATEGKKVKDCDFTILSLFKDVNNLVKMITEDDELVEVRDFFSGLTQKDSKSSSGNVMETTVETEVM